MRNHNPNDDYEIYFHGYPNNTVAQAFVDLSNFMLKVGLFIRLMSTILWFLWQFLMQLRKVYMYPFQTCVARLGKII